MQRFYQGNAYEAAASDNPEVNGLVAMHEAWSRTHETQPLKPIRWHYEDGEGEVDMELNQDNCGVEVNFCTDEADCVWVVDPRDNMAVVTFRNEMEPAQFDGILKALGHLALPKSWVWGEFLKRQARDLSKADNIPSDWQ